MTTSPSASGRWATKNRLSRQCWCCSRTTESGSGIWWTRYSSRAVNRGMPRCWQVGRAASGSCGRVGQPATTLEVVQLATMRGPQVRAHRQLRRMDRFGILLRDGRGRLGKAVERDAHVDVMRHVHEDVVEP